MHGDMMSSVCQMSERKKQDADVSHLSHFSSSFVTKKERAEIRLVDFVSQTQNERKTRVMMIVTHDGDGKMWYVSHAQEREQSTFFLRLLMTTEERGENLIIWGERNE